MNSSLIDFLNGLDPDVYKTLVVVFILLLIMRFLLTIIKKLLDYNLKQRLIEKGLTDDSASYLFQSNDLDERTNSIKWFSIMLSTGFGLLIVDSFLPLGFHSIAIMFVSISMGFLAYSYYLKTINKED